MAARSYPEDNLQTIASLDRFKEKSVDFTYQFGESLKSFQDALGISRMMPVQEGMTINLYGKPTATLASGVVAEGAIIPLSYVTPEVASQIVISLLKYRKATSGEAIQRYGLDQAIDYTDAAMVKEVQKIVRTDLFTLIQGAELASDSLNAQNGMQGALAAAWGAMQVAFEDDTVQVIVFAHPMDVAQAIADKSLTLENAFGMNYYTAATGTIVFTTTQVAQGSIYATASDNLVIAYIPASTSELGKAFGLTADSSGFIGMTHFMQEESLTQQTLMVSGVKIFPERLDGIVKVAIDGSSETKGIVMFTVLDAEGLALEGVAITIGDDTVLTGSDGKAKFIMTAGAETWAAVLDGYDLDKATATVTFVAGSTVDVAITATESA